jgi:GDP-6-deoxy-D-talose 4-dehydrogenase
LRILVTGADGFTGQHLSAMAQADGHTILALQANLTDSDAVRIEVQKLQPSHAIHLAAISFVGHATEKAFYDINLFGTLNLLTALIALEMRPASVLLASSANIYGNCQTSPISENQMPAPRNHYGVSKLAMEHMARTYGDRLPVVISRPFNYTGPGQSIDFVVPKLVHHFKQTATRVRLGDLKVRREFNDVQMVCRAYLGLLQHGVPGETYNVCSGQPHTVQDVIDTLIQLTGHRIGIEIDPGLLRPNEVHHLCGNPAKLHALLSPYGMLLRNPPLKETLTRMLTASAHVTQFAS